MGFIILILHISISQLLGITTYLAIFGGLQLFIGSNLNIVLLALPKRTMFSLI